METEKSFICQMQITRFHKFDKIARAPQMVSGAMGVGDRMFNSIAGAAGGSSQARRWKMKRLSIKPSIKSN